jgi:hypothetical protein
MGGTRGAALACVTTAALRRAAASAPVAVPGGSRRWERTNHRGEPVSMLEGPVVAAGLVVGAAAARPGTVALASALATAGAGAFGVVDDLSEDATTRTKGLRGHLGALGRGRLTTGGLKVLGIGAVALAAAAIGGPAAHGPRRALAATADLVVDTGLVAGTANLVNLLDLRPGRALKATTLAAGALALAAPATRGLGAVVVGSAAAAARRDLAEQDMLGDGGANALGALVGAQAAFGLPRVARTVLLGGVVALTLASERVSFSAVIDGSPVLRAADRWGRRA